MYKRVVITGLGAVSSLGIGWPTFWENLLSGKSGISKISQFNTSNFERHNACEIKNYSHDKFKFSSRFNKFGRSSQLAILASKLALKDALFENQSLRRKIGIFIGTTMGESRIFENINDLLINDPKTSINSFLPLLYPSNTIITNLYSEFNSEGENCLFANACAAGNYSLGYAFDLIRTGRIDIALAGGVDSFSRVAFSGFHRLLAIAPEKCQPFDLNRKGILVGEGAGILVVEDYQHAINRGAKIYAEILGLGFSCDAQHMTNPDPLSVAKAINKTLKYSNIKPKEVDYISAHGTGTLENDKAECKAYNEIFGFLKTKIPMSSIKSMIGHTMGAAAALESIACCLALRYSEIPPTINFENKDPQCDIDCVPNKSRKQKCQIVLNNSQAFGGNNACILFSNRNLLNLNYEK